MIKPIPPGTGESSHQRNQREVKCYM